MQNLHFDVSFHLQLGNSEANLNVVAATAIGATIKIISFAGYSREVIAGDLDIKASETSA